MTMLQRLIFSVDRANFGVRYGRFFLKPSNFACSRSNLTALYLTIKRSIRGPLTSVEASKLLILGTCTISKIKAIILLC